jgi:hypothetical protein
MLNFYDLADLLSLDGSSVDYDTGEVFYRPESLHLMIMLAALGKITIGRDEFHQPTFFIPDLNISTIEQYCEAYPSDPQCKCYEV